MAESKQIEAMRKLGMTEEEIAEILEEDKAIDRSGTSDKVFDWEMNPEDHKKAMKLANSDEKKKTTKAKRERKADPTKRGIIQALFDCLDENYERASIDNPERVITFWADGNPYQVTLSFMRNLKKEMSGNND